MIQNIRFIRFAVGSLPSASDLWIAVIVLCTVFDKHIPWMVWALLALELLIMWSKARTMRKENDSDEV